MGVQRATISVMAWHNQLSVIVAHEFSDDVVPEVLPSLEQPVVAVDDHVIVLVAEQEDCVVEVELRDVPDAEAVGPVITLSEGEMAYDDADLGTEPLDIAVPGGRYVVTVEDLGQVEGGHGFRFVFTPAGAAA